MSTAQQLVPKTIKLAGGNNTLAIEWADGHRSAFPYTYLRRKCPCATCTQPGSSRGPAGNVLPMLGVKPLKPERAELVGRYALQVFWSDAHSSGIYSFEYLRGLCPCAECTGKQEAEGAGEGKVP